MDQDWLNSGFSSTGFDWHGSSTISSRRAIVDLHQKFKQVWYLERAVKVARSVARVVFPNGTTFATCFLVAPNLILTNHHVFSRPEDTDNVRIQFNYRQQFEGGLAKPIQYYCDASTFITDKDLDYTLVTLTKEARPPYLSLRHSEIAAIADHIAIIQHPKGAPLQIAIRDNSLEFYDDVTVEYLTNTDYGSSGSPVFNDNWNVIALHSQRVKDPNGGGWYRNRGTRIEAILANPHVAQLIPD